MYSDENWRQHPSRTDRRSDPVQMWTFQEFSSDSPRNFLDWHLVATETTLEKEVKRFVFFIAGLAILSGIIFFIVGIFVIGKSKTQLIDNLINTIGIIVANVPEGESSWKLHGIFLEISKNFQKLLGNFTEKWQVFPLPSRSVSLLPPVVWPRETWWRHHEIDMTLTCDRSGSRSWKP